MNQAIINTDSPSKAKAISDVASVDKKAINNPLQFANKYLGFNETNKKHQSTIKGFLNKAVGNNWVKSDSEVSQDNRAWCAAFVNNVLSEGNFKYANAPSWSNVRAKSYSSIGEKVQGISSASPGDVVITRNKENGTYHVGFYSGKSGDNHTMLGGNQGTFADPDRGLEVTVKDINLDKNDIFAVRRVSNVEEMSENELSKLYSGKHYVPVSEGTR